MYIITLKHLAVLCDSTPLPSSTTGLEPHNTARHMLGTCLALPRVFTYTVTCHALLCSYRVISGEGCVSLVMVNWPLLLLCPEALHTTGALLIHTAMLGTCHARQAASLQVSGKISFVEIASYS